MAARWPRMAIEETLRGIHSLAEILGLSKFPIIVSVVFSIIFGFMCYKLLTYTPVQPAAPTLSTGSIAQTGNGNAATTGANSPIVSSYVSGTSPSEKQSK